jgi:hypothetical protein
MTGGIRVYRSSLRDVVAIVMMVPISTGLSVLRAIRNNR